MTDPITDTLAGHVASALERPLDAEVAEKASLHILDSLAACVSGSTLPAGKAGSSYALRAGAADEAAVLGTPGRASAQYAALANGMAAHADETDDSHAPSRTHPGSSIVPAALAVAESRGASGRDVLRAVTLGYDVCGRVPAAIWPDHASLAHAQSTHAVGGLFGVTVTAGALYGVPRERVPYLISYATQQASGLRTYLRDTEHIEKAFVFSGMPAFNGLLVAQLVDAGWTGVEDPLQGSPDLFSLGDNPRPEAIVEELGQRYEVMRADIKRYPAGSPVQAPLHGLLGVLRDEQLASAEVAAVRIRLSPTLLRVTNGQRKMSNINSSYLVSVALDDQVLSLHNAHDEERFARWHANGGDPRIEFVPDESLGHDHTAHVTVVTRDGRERERFVETVPGRSGEPMARADVEDKARELIEPVLGADRTAALIDAMADLGAIDDVRELTALCSAEEVRA